MNFYVERVEHYTLDDGNYLPLLRFCNDAAVNLMISFPDIDHDSGGRLIPFDETELVVPDSSAVNKKYFGNRSTGIEVTLIPGDNRKEDPAAPADTVIAETYGLPDREHIMVKSFRGRGESRYNRVVELHISAPQMKSSMLIGLFKTAFSNTLPDDEKICSLKKDAAGMLSCGKWADASGVAEYILCYRPDDPESLAIDGAAKAAEGDWRGARKNLLKASEMLPENSDVWFNLGLAYMEGDDNGSALHCFEKALEFNPQNHGAYYMKGVILEETGKGEDAVVFFRYAVKYSPGTHKGRMNSRRFYTPQAVEALERLGSPWRGDEELPDPEGVDINEDLVRAASAGDVKKIGSLLKKGAIPDYRSHDNSMHGRTPLISAALKGYTHAVKYLLEHGAGIDFADTCGCAPLGSVLEWGAGHDMIRLMVEHGADVNGKDPYRRPLVLNERALGDAEILYILADAGADLNVTDDHGANGVYCASAAGNIDTAEFFIEHGADINIRNRSGSTPLMAAVINGKHKMLRHLLVRGADSGIPDHEGRTPLMIATEKADAEGLAILIAAGADVNKRDNMGRSAIDIILESGRRDNMEAYRKCIDLLTDAGAELLHGG